MWKEVGLISSVICNLMMFLNLLSRCYNNEWSTEHELYCILYKLKRISVYARYAVGRFRYQLCVCSVRISVYNFLPK